MTELSGGPYNVIVQDVNGEQSSPYTIAVDTAGTVIPSTPQYSEEEYFACIGDASVEIEVLEPSTEDTVHFGQPLFFEITLLIF